jgi:hypothetical protein
LKNTLDKKQRREVERQRLLFEMKRLENDQKLGDYFTAGMRVTGEWVVLEKIDALCLSLDYSPAPEQKEEQKATAVAKISYPIFLKALTGKTLVFTVGPDYTYEATLEYCLCLTLSFIGLSN